MAARAMLARSTLLRPAPSLMRPTALSVRPFHISPRTAARSSPIVRAVASSIHDGSFIKGTVNEPTTYPEPSKVHGSYHWTFERLLSATLLPVVATTFVTSPNSALDGVLAVTLIIHSHLGFDQSLLDYLHDRKFPVLGPTVRWAVRAATVGVLIGVYEFNTNDIGLTELIKRSWKAAA